MRILALLLFVLSASMAQPAPILLGERIPGRAIGTQAELLWDESGSLSRTQVMNSPWKERFEPSGQDNVNLGYRKGVLWMRLELERGAAIGPWALEITYPLLDKVDVYGPGMTTPWKGGDHRRLSERALADRNFLFPVDAPEQGVNVYLIRVETQGTLSVPLRLWDRESLERSKRDETFVLGAYYGLLLVMIFYNLFLFAIVRDRAYAAYAIYVATMGFLLVVNNGYGGLYLWPESPALADWAQVASAPLTCALAALFTRQYLLTYANAPRADRLLAAITWAGLGFALVATLLPRALIFWADHLLALITIGGTCASGILAWKRGYGPARYYLIAFATVFVGASFMVARNFGMPANLFTDHGMQIGSALEVVLLSMGLAARITVLRHEKEQAQSQALSSQQMMVEALRETERKLESRVLERTEELEALNRSLQAEVAEREKTAALLKASEERMRYQAQHDALTGLPNRWLLRDRLVQATARAKRDRTAFAVLLADLDNFKAVNDSLGHDVGDLLIVEVAQRLSTCIRERDTIARLGGDEFVIVLEGLAAPEDSALIARKIVDSLAAPFPIAGELLRTSPSIGISLYPEDGQDADFLLKFADIAMYRAKAAGRNCYRFYREPEQLHAYDQKA